ncbi:MAG: ABC transporter permease [Thermoanaerobaculia bacterium]|nr:ABC transporter permease [Thermoanaerobaculia bacterium]
MSASPDFPAALIRPTAGWRALDLAEFWRYHELLYFIVWRDLKMRFKQTVLGVVWVVLKPLLPAVMMTLVFGKLARVPSDGLPYAVFIFAAMIPWNYFSGATSGGTLALVGNAHLICKVYFPRLIIPVSVVLSGLVDVMISLCLLGVLMAWYGQVPPLAALWGVPLLLLLTMAIALGVGLWLGSLNVRYRDIGNAVPFLLQVWMYATPVIYPLSLVPERFRPFLLLNPMVGVTEGFRSAIFGRPWSLDALAASVAIALVLLGGGLFFFRSSERTFADTV